MQTWTFRKQTAYISPAGKLLNKFSTIFKATSRHLIHIKYTAHSSTLITSLTTRVFEHFSFYLLLSFLVASEGSRTSSTFLNEKQRI